MNTPRTGRMIWAWAIISSLMLSMVGLTGCGSTGGSLTIRSQSISETSAVLEGGFDAGVYRFDDTDNLTIVLYRGPMEQPTQAVTMRMFWRPAAGRTPIDPNATNVTIHYIIFPSPSHIPASSQTDQAGTSETITAQVGIYSGAGFLLPSGKRHSNTLAGKLLQSNLLLTDHTSHFNDLFGPALMVGHFKAHRNDVATEQLLETIQDMIRQRLGHRRMVRAD